MALPAFVVPLISAGVAAAGTAQQARAAKKSRQEQARLMAAERARQAEIQDEQRRAALDSLGQFESDKQKQIQDEIVGRNLQQVSEMVSKAPSAQSFRPGTQPEVIKRQFESEAAKAADQSGAFAQALAEFGAQGQALQRAGLNALSNAQTIDRLGYDMGQSANLLDMEMMRARDLADSPMGNMMVGLGQAGLAASLAGDLQFGKGKKSKPFRKTGKLSEKEVKQGFVKF